eukprot:12369715-Alexandrium_andersonii.AAC.1
MPPCLGFTLVLPGSSVGIFLSRSLPPPSPASLQVCAQLAEPAKGAANNSVGASALLLAISI